MPDLLPDDIAGLVSVAEPAVSPDGSAVLVTVTTVDLDANRYRSAIWVVPTTTGAGEPRPLTDGDRSDSGARWSPDGSRIAFVRAEHDGDDIRSTLVVLPVDAAGDPVPVPVATATAGISSLDWSPDGTRLAWCQRVLDPGADLKDRDREPRRIDTLATRLDGTGWTVDRRQHVFVGRADGVTAQRQLTTGPFDHGGPRWSPDGQVLVCSGARHDGWDLDGAVDLYLLDAGDGAEGAVPRRLTGSRLQFSSPSWSPDGTRVAALARDESHGWHNARPLVLDVASGDTVDVAPGIDRTFAPFPGEQPPVWVDDATLLVSREDRGRVGVLRLDADGSGRAVEVHGGACWVLGFDQAAATFAAVAATPEHPGELYVAGERSSHLTASFHTRCPPLVPERFTVASPAGDGDVDAWFVAPAGAGEPGAGRWPLLVSIHGGPMTQYGDRWFDEWQLWSSAGFAVVGCNPHGGSGRDDAWARAIRSPLAEVDPGTGWGGIDADDVLAVLDATLERWPATDPARVGIHGGSYGGFLTSWLCARTDRFAAGCSERAVNNLLSEEWSSDVGGTFHRELGVSHLEHPEEYLRMSPATYAGEITCPLLILHSEDDLRCHVEQADCLFVALRLLGREVEYWRFPGEGHELSRSGAPRHRIRRAELIVDFFRRTLAPG